jgi:hypothetical protein
VNLKEIVYFHLILNEHILPNIKRHLFLVSSPSANFVLAEGKKNYIKDGLLLRQ